jgi:hypothetical protein
MLRLTVRAARRTGPQARRDAKDVWPSLIIPSDNVKGVTDSMLRIAVYARVVHDSGNIPNAGWPPLSRWNGWLPKAAFMPEASSFPIFLRATMPKAQSPTPARGQGAGGLECPYRRSARCSKARRTCRVRGQASPDDGDTLALTFAQPVEPAEIEEEDDEEEFGGYGGHSSSGGWMR